jgi:hypothetical protein
MPRLGNDSNRTVDYFCIRISSTDDVAFPPNIIKAALRQGLQDYMQDNDLHAGVDIEVKFDYELNRKMKELSE